MNNFIKISFVEITSSINVRFIKQPRESDKYYSVRYGQVDPSCQNLPMLTRGHLSNSNSITIELNINPDKSDEVCLSVIVTNVTKTVSVEGVFKVTGHGKYYFRPFDIWSIQY